MYMYIIKYCIDVFYCRITLYWLTGEYSPFNSGCKWVDFTQRWDHLV